MSSIGDAFHPLFPRLRADLSVYYASEKGARGNAYSKRCGFLEKRTAVSFVFIHKVFLCFILNLPIKL